MSGVRTSTVQIIAQLLGVALDASFGCLVSYCGDFHHAAKANMGRYTKDMRHLVDLIACGVPLALITILRSKIN